MNEDQVRAVLGDLLPLARVALRQDPPADPRDVGACLAKLTEVDELLYPGAWRFEAEGGPGLHGGAWRLYVSGVGYAYEPRSLAELYEWRPALRQDSWLDTALRAFFHETNARLEVRPWKPFSFDRDNRREKPGADDFGWVWVRVHGDAEPNGRRIDPNIGLAAKALRDFDANSGLPPRKR